MMNEIYVNLINTKKIEYTRGVGVLGLGGEGGTVSQIVEILFTNNSFEVNEFG